MNGQIRQVAVKLTHSRRLKKIMAVLIVVVVGLGLLSPVVERSGQNPVIVSEWDGMYFALTTVTGVGYGDMVPVTDGGRVIAIILQTFGVILFGAIVASVSVELLRYQEDYYVRRMLTRMDELEMKLDEMEKHLDFLVKK